MISGPVNLNPAIIGTPNTNFRAFVTAVRQMFLNVGWVRTADTGQIDPTSVTDPVAQNSSKGYDIFRMDDGLQGTAPVFAKVEYGADDFNGNSQLEMGLWVTVGQGSDGAGNLTGKQTSRIQLSNRLDNNGVLPCHCSGSSSRIVMNLFRWSAAAQPTRGNMLLSIERTHDANGADTTEGVLVITNGSRGQTATRKSWCQPLIFGVTSAQTENEGAPATMNGSQASAGDGAGNTGVWPWMIPGRRGPENPSRNVLSYWLGDLTPDNDVPVTIYGLAHTYRTLGAAVAGQGSCFAGVYADALHNATMLAMRYE